MTGGKQYSMKSWKDNISFILVEPQEPGNIGASARAMKNMGFSRLELVHPGYFFSSEAKQMACQGITILENAKVHKNFTDAIEDKPLVIGTTRRLGRRRGLILPLKDSVRRIITASGKNKVAILFGRERIGLTNQEIEKCGLLITIPSDPSTPSLNLAQSVMLVAYELSRKTYKTAYPELIKHKELDPLYSKIEATLKLLEFIPRGDADLEKKIMKNLRHLIGRSGLTEWELKMLYGLCAQVEKRMNRGD
jgi:TrmH family RNA methyltransferase